MGEETMAMQGRCLAVDRRREAAQRGQKHRGGTTMIPLKIVIAAKALRLPSPVETFLAERKDTVIALRISFFFASFSFLILLGFLFSALSTMKTSTLVAASAGTILTGLLGEPLHSLTCRKWRH